MKRSMRLPPKKENMEDIPIEEDVPKDFRPDEAFPIDHNNNVKPNEVTKDVFNTIKGHNLLGWCVFILVGIYVVEFFGGHGKVSEVAEKIIEIVKLLIFSLTGYLFGTNANKND